MNRLYSLTAPLLIAAAGAIPAIPTIPTLGGPGPLTSGIVALDDGTVFFVDSFSHTVWRLQPGTSLDPFVTGRNGRSLCMDADGHLYGTHEDESGRITTWRADGNGNVVNVAQTEAPSGHTFIVEEDGAIVASRGSGRRTGVRLVRTAHDDHHHELLAGGEMGFRDGAGSHAQFFPIGGMTRTPEGDLLVTSGTAIRRVGPDGKVRTIAKGERLLKPRYAFLARIFGEVHGHLSGIAVGVHGDIYVANSARSAVIRIDRYGSAEELVTAEDGWTPTGVATAGGSLYILEYGHGVRVRRIDANGTLSTMALVPPDRTVAAAVTFGRFPVPGTIG